MCPFYGGRLWFKCSCKTWKNCPLYGVSALEYPFCAHIFKLILRVVNVLLLTTVFSFFSCVSDNLIFTLLYWTIYINYKSFSVPLENCKVVSFGCSRIAYSLIFVLSSPPSTAWNTICWIALGSASKAFYLLKSTAIKL